MSAARGHAPCPVRPEGQPCALRDVGPCDLLAAGEPEIKCGPCIHCGLPPDEARRREMKAALAVAKKAMAKLNRAQRAMERYDSYVTRTAASRALDDWFKAQRAVEETGVHVKWVTA